MNKKFSYIPSFGAGALMTNAKNGTMLGDIDAKFWSDEFPQEFRHPYFLLSAGHLYKKLDSRERMKLENSFVLGDSGGFQIVTGQLKYSQDLVHQIFNWLEANSDVAMNLDIPPRGENQGVFKESLDISIKNYEYFEKNQTGKTKYLNVIHGYDLDSYQIWYDACKHFEFNGWAIGGGGASVFKFFAGLAVLLNGKEHLNKRNEYIHVLGTSTVRHFFLLAGVQKVFNKLGIDITLMTDSSTPNITSRFGNYMYSYDLKNLSCKYFHIEREPKPGSGYEGHPLPLSTPYDKWLNEITDLGTMSKFSAEQYNGFVHHNLFLLLKMKEDIEYYVNGPKYILSQVTMTDMVKILDIIEEMITSDNPIYVFHKHELFINKFDRATIGDETFVTKDISKSKFFK